MKIIIFGGAGFVGVNTARRFLNNNYHVVIYDNLSRHGAVENIQWLKSGGGNLTFVRGDIRDYKTVLAFLKEHKDVKAIYHFASQVAVTTSVKNPRDDFEINALGTFNILDIIREIYSLVSPPKVNDAPFFVYSSTNKVYGRMEGIKIIEKDERYQYCNFDNGISENSPLDFYSPYGCSKGAADQYVIDFHRIYGIRTVTFRQSCIYGYRQFGVEDQGWVAWFIIASILGKSLTIYGDGKQVRDILFIEDLVNVYEQILLYQEKVAGEVYNIGGGPNNQMSLLELIQLIEELSGKKLIYSFSDWRPGDQLIFVCDIRKAHRDFGWKPSIDVKTGVSKLFKWVYNNKSLFQ